MTDPDLIGVAEAATLIGVRKITLHRWVRAGRMAAVMTHPQHVFTRTEVDRVVAERNEEPQR